MTYGVFSEENIRNISENNKITSLNPRSVFSSHFPAFNNLPLVFCSFYCKGYEDTYLAQGITFKTDSPIAYACPADGWELMRSGKYLPGHEQFVFSSIEKMLEKYPSCLDFRKDFEKYFKELKPSEVYPDLNKEIADKLYKFDICFSGQYFNQKCYNEIAFKGPLNIKNIRRYNNKGELDKLLL